LIVQGIIFTRELSDPEVRRIVEKQAPEYRALLGQAQKYDVRALATGDLSGVYATRTCSV
jgi:hypothetical protein